MRIYGTFKDETNTTVTVTIINNDISANDINIDTSSNIRFSDEPVTIKYDCDDSFVHIIKTSAQINLVTKSWLGDYLFASNYTSVSVSVTRNGATLFSGYVTPNTYQQDYARDWETLSVNCVGKLSILENQYITDGTTYEDVVAASTTKTFKDVLDEILPAGNVYYDQSKSYGSYTNIFEGLMISEGLFLGEDEDDVWTNEEILEEIMKYFNLHIIQRGNAFYMFDWDTMRTKSSVPWLRLSDNAVAMESFGTTNLTKNQYAGDDTQLSIADVFNQIQVTDDITELETVLNSPLDDDNMLPLIPKMKYLVEYGTNGCEVDAMEALTTLARDNGTPQNDKAYTREWWMQIYNNERWSFKLNNTDNYSHIPTSAGAIVNPAQFLKWIYETPFSSALLGFGSGSKVTNKNNQNIENIEVKDKYLVINVMGNGIDEKSANRTCRDKSYWPSDWTLENHPPYPGESDLQNLDMEIAYNYTTDASYSPATDSVTHYLVFSGEMLMTTPQATLGVSGFDPHASWTDPLGAWHVYRERVNMETGYANENKGDYCDFKAFTRKNNNYIITKTHLKLPRQPEDPGYPWFGSMTADESDDRGHYYMQRYFNNLNSSYTETADEGHIYLSPPIVQGDLDKRFNYSIGEKTSYFQNDVVKYVDILACELKIGDKWCVEDHNAVGDKTFTWMTAEEIQQQSIQYPYIYIAINIDDGQYLIGDSHKIYNNIYSNMYLENTTGMAIPITAQDGLSGTMSFKIIGPVNSTWDQGIRRHPTWFRHTSYTANSVSILPHVGQIWIKNFDVKLVSDHGKQDIGADDDIVYCSDEQDRFINKKDDIEFRITTALTVEEAAALGVSVTANRSDVIGADTGIPITAITNKLTNETDKPEKFYVDAYYREYCDPKIVMKSTLHSGDILVRKRVGYLNRVFLVRSLEHDVRRATKTITAKEI